MKRTSADFADDAREELFELTLDDGTVIEPRSMHDLSYDDNLERQKNTYRWMRWHDENRESFEAPADAEIEGEKFISPDEWDFRFRFGKHYDAWFAEWRKRPRRKIIALCAEIDTFYDPEPASDPEKAAMAAGDADAAGKSGGAET